MFKMYLILLAVGSWSCSTTQTDAKENCRYFKIAAADSVCLDVADNLDTAKVDQIIKEEKKDLLIIFEGWVNGDMELLRDRFLRNQKIRKALQGFKIIRLYVDDRAKVRPQDRLSIGAKNMIYQGNRFNTLSQPFFVIIKEGKPLCHSGYSSSQETMLKFLVNCQKD